MLEPLKGMATAFWKFGEAPEACGSYLLGGYVATGHTMHGIIETRVVVSPYVAGPKPSPFAERRCRVRSIEGKINGACILQSSVP